MRGGELMSADGPRDRARGQHARAWALGVCGAGRIAATGGTAARTRVSVCATTGGSAATTGWTVPGTGGSGTDGCGNGSCRTGASGAPSAAG